MAEEWKQKQRRVIKGQDWFREKKTGSCGESSLSTPWKNLVHERRRITVGKLTMKVMTNESDFLTSAFLLWTYTQCTNES